MINPLLDFSGLPSFDRITPAHVAPAVTQLLDENRRLLETLRSTTVAPTWENFVQPLEDANERLSRAWGQVSHLNAVVNSPALREAYNANLPKVTQYYAALSQDQILFEKFKRLHAAHDFSSLSPAQQRVIVHELRDFRLGGAALSPTEKERFLDIQEQLASLSAKFEDNVLDATNDFAWYVNNVTELTGVPADVVQAAREAAEQDGKPGWKLTLRAPSYLPVMQYADHRPLRETIYRAYATRASEFGPSAWDNTPLIRQILALRQEAAHLLGFANYAEVSLASKMAETPRQVLDFLDELAAKGRSYARKDLADLTNFARDTLGLPEIAAWDIAYVSEKLRQQRYAFSEQEIKQYLPETVVLPGMFQLVTTLYGLSIAPVSAPGWHPDVRCYQITDREGTPLGWFYLDLYARENKRGGAWMDDAIGRRRRGDDLQMPVAYLNCNFSAPVGGKPALFTHDEVITLFHEFGHGLHHLLTQVDVLGVSGINGVEWDAVELPSQFMENFCWEWAVLHPMTRHVDSGEPLPRALFDRLLAAKNFQSGMQLVRQLEFSLFDMRLHADYDPTGTQSPLQLLDIIRDQVAVIFPPAYHRFPNNFSHIFAGGYGAGYYSYKWAEVLSADAYSLFEENGVLNAETGHRFWSEVLSVGGSRPALESFTRFRGRAPVIDALLRHHGMT